MNNTDLSKIALPESLIFDSEISKTDIALYAAMVMMSNKRSTLLDHEGRSYIVKSGNTDKKVLMELTGISEATFKRSVSSLRNANWLTYERITGGKRLIKYMVFDDNRTAKAILQYAGLSQISDAMPDYEPDMEMMVRIAFLELMSGSAEILEHNNMLYILTPYGRILCGEYKPIPDDFDIQNMAEDEAEYVKNRLFSVSNLSQRGFLGIKFEPKNDFSVSNLSQGVHFDPNEARIFVPSSVRENHALYNIAHAHAIYIYLSNSWILVSLFNHEPRIFDSETALVSSDDGAGAESDATENKETVTQEREKLYRSCRLSYDGLASYFYNGYKSFWDFGFVGEVADVKRQLNKARGEIHGLLTMLRDDYDIALEDVSRISEIGSVCGKWSERASRDYSPGFFTKFSKDERRNIEWVFEKVCGELRIDNPLSEPEYTIERYELTMDSINDR